MIYNLTISDLSLFKQFLSQSKSGDIINISTNVKLLINESLTVPKGVIIDGGGYKYGAGGAFIQTTAEYPESQYVALFKLLEGSILKGLRIQGSNKEIFTLSKTRTSVSNPIKFEEKNCSVINCEIFDGDKWGVYALHPQDALIDGCFIHHCKVQGYGYGVWMGGRGGIWNGGLIQNCIFDNCRAAVDGNGGDISYTIKDNIFSPQQTYGVIARHGNAMGGGGHFVIDGNVVLNKTQKSLEVPSPWSNGSLKVINNSFQRSVSIGNLTAPPYLHSGITYLNNTIAESTPALQFSLKDNCETPNSKIMFKVIFNDNLIFEAPGGAYNDWKTIYVDLRKYILTGKTNTLSLNLEVQPGVYDTYFWLDNIKIFGNNLINGSFEDGSLSGWSQIMTKGSNFGTRIVQEETYNGDFSYRWGFGSFTGTSIINITQKIKF